MAGEIITLFYISFGLLTKSLLEAAYFKEREDAKKTLSIWALCTATLLFSLGVSLILDYFG